MAEPSASPRDRAPAPEPPSIGPTPSGLRLPEPPPFRAHPLAPPGACVNCGNSVGSARVTPRCWECGRALCAECYWRHGLSPADHRCAGCTARTPPPSTSISGGRVTPL
ncbi:MAG TPA: hypothetical protein VML94_05940 [Thermoplasmata archaeon]|nr:hypothetical protein [Thermoplasmata archaeon]